MLFPGIQQSVDPGQQFFCCVVGVDDHRDSVKLGNLMDVLSAGDAPFDGDPFVFILQ